VANVGKPFDNDQKNSKAIDNATIQEYKLSYKMKQQKPSKEYVVRSN
jgi:hypothetical protein